MKSESQALLASFLTFAGGVWMLITPVFISMTGAALTSILIAGSVITLAGLTQMLWDDNNLPSWISGLAAVWLFVSAFAYTMSDGAVWNQAITAGVLFLLAIWDSVEIGHVRLEHRRHISV